MVFPPIRSLRSLAGAAGLRFFEFARIKKRLPLQALGNSFTGWADSEQNVMLKSQNHIDSGQGMK